MTPDWHKYEAMTGVSILSWAGLSHLLTTVYPFIAFVAVTCGAILGLHGVYCLIFKKDKEPHNSVHITPHDHNT